MTGGASLGGFNFALTPAFTDVSDSHPQVIVWQLTNPDLSPASMKNRSRSDSPLVFALLSACTDGKAEPSGEADFRMSCSACHGDDGRGGGAKDFGLSIKPPDLTELAKD